MKNVASPTRTLAAITALTVGALAILAIASVAAAQGGQSTSEEEVAARLRAKLEAQMAEINARVERQLAELRALREHELSTLSERLEVLREGEMRELLESRLAAHELIQDQSVEESLRRAQEATRRALATAQRTLQRMPRNVRVISSGWRTGCDEYGWEIVDHAEDLALSDAQIEQIRDTQRAHRRDSIQREADIDVAEMDLEELFDAAEPNIAAIRAKLEEVAMLEVEDQMAGLQLRQDLRDVLTPEQLDDFDEMREDSDHVRIFISGVGRLSRFGRFGC